MIDPSLRLERIAAEARDETCGVLLLALLGYGAHQTPPTSSPRPCVTHGPPPQRPGGAPGRRVAHGAEGDLQA